ncbi:hypothetical protein DFH09DRAFT_1492529 [Mycena vulgaris]|nr:hypothetical protein DFH09DRAFT_1492529 [Mycena vulgaris]
MAACERHFLSPNTASRRFSPVSEFLSQYLTNSQGLGLVLTPWYIDTPAVLRPTNNLRITSRPPHHVTARLPPRRLPFSTRSTRRVHDDLRTRPGCARAYGDRPSSRGCVSRSPRTHFLTPPSGHPPHEVPLHLASPAACAPRTRMRASYCACGCLRCRGTGAHHPFGFLLQLHLVSCEGSNRMTIARAAFASQAPRCCSRAHWFRPIARPHRRHPRGSGTAVSRVHSPCASLVPAYTPLRPPPSPTASLELERLVAHARQPSPLHSLFPRRLAPAPAVPPSLRPSPAHPRAPAAPASLDVSWARSWA